MSKTTDTQLDVLGVTFVLGSGGVWYSQYTPCSWAISLRQHQGKGNDRWLASCHFVSSGWATTPEEALTSALGLFRADFARRVAQEEAVERQLGHIMPITREK